MAPVSLKDVANLLHRLDEMQDGDRFLTTKKGDRIYTEEVTHMQAMSKAIGGKISKIGTVKREQEHSILDCMSSDSEIEFVGVVKPDLQKKAVAGKNAKQNVCEDGDIEEVKRSVEQSAISDIKSEE